MSAEDPDLTAAELALGLLDGDERAAAQRRVLAEPTFAAEVDLWRERFAALVAWVPDVDPPAALLGRIEDSLSTQHAQPAAVRRRWVWPSLAALSSIAAALLLFMLLNTPAPVIVPSTPLPSVQLAAAIVATQSGRASTALYSPGSGELRLTAASFADDRHAAELWVIGADGVPYSLGLLQREKVTALTVPVTLRSRLVARATLAVSTEPLGGSPTGKPTGPVVAKGLLAHT